MLRPNSKRMGKMRIKSTYGVCCSRLMKGDLLRLLRLLARLGNLVLMIRLLLLHRELLLDLGVDRVRPGRRRGLRESLLLALLL